MIHSVGVSQKIANMIIKLLPGKETYSPLRRYWKWLPLGFCKTKKFKEIFEALWEFQEG